MHELEVDLEDNFDVLMVRLEDENLEIEFEIENGREVGILKSEKEQGLVVDKDLFHQIEIVQISSKVQSAVVERIGRVDLEAVHRNHCLI